MASATVVGATGLVGSEMVRLLIADGAFGQLTVFGRRPLAETVAGSSKVAAVIEPESGSWPSRVAATDVFLSALGTTRAVAGSVQQQIAIDQDLNLSLAQAARKAGTKVYVLVSSANADARSIFAYPKMKGQLEADVAAQAFDHTILLQPALITGDRAALSQPGRLGEGAAAAIVRPLSAVMSAVGLNWTLMNPADTIAAAALEAVKLCRTGKRPDGKTSGVWTVRPAEIAKLAADYSGRL